MKKLCIIADDITGAGDTGVQFSKFGIPTAVIFNDKTIKELGPSFDVLAVNTGTRNVDKNTAYKQIRNIIRMLKDTKINMFYKKIDSTLRGQPDVEIAAMLDELRYKIAFIVPSYPANGRKVEDGYLYIHKNSENGNDTFQQIGFIPDVFKNMKDRNTCIINIDEIRKGKDNIKNVIDELISQNNQIFIMDAVTDDDLRNIALTVKDYAKESVVAGSAGLAGITPLILNMPCKTWFHSSNKPVLFLAGTRNAVTAEQLKALADVDKARIVMLNSGKIVGKERQEEIEKATLEARKALSNGINTAVVVDTLFDSQSETYNQETSSKNGQIIAKSFGDIAKGIVDDKLIYAIVATGGDVAINVFDVLGAKGIKLEDEILPGIPIGTLIGGKFDGLHVVTKAGGFGDKNSFVDILNCLNMEGANLK